MRFLQANISKEAATATFHNVDRFFKQDYPVIYRRSGDWGLSSPRLDGMPQSTNRTNTSERRMIDYSIFSNAHMAVIEALKGCPKESRIIIEKWYLQQAPAWQVKQAIGIAGHSSYSKRLQKACLEFADCLEATCARFKVDEKVIQDLHAKRDEAK